MIYLLTYENWKNDYTSAPHIKNINIDELKSLLKTTHSNYMCAKSNMFRGISNDKFYTNINIVDPTQITRQSPWASGNMHNTILSNSPLWKEFPRRNKSIIFDFNSIGHVGKEFRVIPENDAILGVCPKNDLWSCFPMDLNDFFNDFINDIFKQYIDDYNDKLAQTNYNYILQCIKKIDDIDYNKIEHDFGFYISKLLKRNKSLSEIINDFINPMKNKFKTIKYDKDFFFDSDVEGWTESKCIIVEPEILDNIDIFK